jgi:hypothetical protein
MTIEELEARIKKLEAKNEELEIKARRSEDILAIMNLQSRYNYYLELNMNDRVADELFSQKDPLVKCEICDSGVYEGIESVRRLWYSMKQGQESERGFFGPVMITTPHIQVAKDGKTAKGMWHGFGPNCVPATVYPDRQNEMTAIWFFGKYNNVYVREKEGWKFRSLQMAVLFRAPYELGWLKMPECRRFAPPPGVLKSDKPSTIYKPYHPHGFYLPLPEPPDPY